MRIVVDTVVASNLLNGSLALNLRELLAPHDAAITFMTVGELTKWVSPIWAPTWSHRSLSRDEAEDSRWR